MNIETKEKIKDWIILTISGIIGALANFLSPYFPDIYSFLSLFLNQFWINLVGVLLILFVGTALYLFRQWRRAYYGIIEVLFALSYGWYAINKVATVGYVEILSIIAAVYLVVRGVDNYMEGRKPKEDTIEP